MIWIDPNDRQIRIRLLPFIYISRQENNMAQFEKLIITAALSGGTAFKNSNPSVPYLPEEFADDAEKCLQEGVSVVHIHARDPETGMATDNINIIRETVEAIQNRCPELVINLSTSITANLTPKQRINPILELKPEIASLDTASMNDGLCDNETGEILYEYIFENPLNFVACFAKTMKENKVKPELKVYGPSGIQNIKLLLKRKAIFEEPLHFQFVYGAFGGVPFSPQMHLVMTDLLPESATYGACGADSNQVPAAIMSMMTGGHVRIGLEDNIRCPGSKLAKGNWEQARWVCGIAKTMDRPIATPAEARKILGLPG